MGGARREGNSDLTLEGLLAKVDAVEREIEEQF